MSDNTKAASLSYIVIVDVTMIQYVKTGGTSGWVTALFLQCAVTLELRLGCVDSVVDLVNINYQSYSQVALLLAKTSDILHT